MSTRYGITTGAALAVYASVTPAVLQRTEGLIIEGFKERAEASTFDDLVKAIQVPVPKGYTHAAETGLFKHIICEKMGLPDALFTPFYFHGFSPDAPLTLNPRNLDPEVLTKVPAGIQGSCTIILKKLSAHIAKDAVENCKEGLVESFEDALFSALAWKVWAIDSPYTYNSDTEEYEKEEGSKDEDDDEDKDDGKEVYKLTRSDKYTDLAGWASGALDAVCEILDLPSEACTRGTNSLDVDIFAYAEARNKSQ